MSINKETRSMLKPHHLDRMPFSDSSIRLTFQQTLHKLWQTYHSSPPDSTERLEAERTIIYLSRHLIARWHSLLDRAAIRTAAFRSAIPLTHISYHIPRDLTKHHARLEESRAVLDGLWQRYLDLGIKFFLRIPLALHSDTRVSDALRRAFEPGHDPETCLDLVMSPIRGRKRIDSIECLLREGRVRDARYSLYCLERLCRTGVDVLGTIETLYEDALALAHAMGSVDSMRCDGGVAEERVMAFKAWQELVQKSVGGKDVLGLSCCCLYQALSLRNSCFINGVLHGQVSTNSEMSSTFVSSSVMSSHRQKLDGEGFAVIVDANPMHISKHLQQALTRARGRIA